LVAVFVGATSGIGEATLKQFAKHTRQPRIYVVRRSQTSADRIKRECQELNSEVDLIFVKVDDISLMRTVDDVCHEIMAKENAINLLFLSCGTMTFKTSKCQF
jgi:short-subunit dehydrogenase